MNQRFNFFLTWEGSWQKAKGSNGTWETRPSGIIGGRGKRSHGGNCETRLAIERAGTVTLHLQRGAPSLYPNRSRPVGEGFKPP